MPKPSLQLIEFPADDPERALAFWSGLLEVDLRPRTSDEGSGWVTDTAGTPVAAFGVHERGRGPGDTNALPYVEVDEIGFALEQVEALGGSIVHPGDRWAICRDSEGSPFALAARVETAADPDLEAALETIDARAGGSVEDPGRPEDPAGEDGAPHLALDEDQDTDRG